MAVAQILWNSIVLDRMRSTMASMSPRQGRIGPHSASIRQLRTDLSIQYQRLAHHPQVRQREQRRQLRGVLLQPAVAHLDEAELSFDHAERVLYLGAYAGLELLDLFGQGLARNEGVERLAL